MTVRHLRIDTGQRTEPLVGLQLGFGPTGDVGGLIVLLPRLLEKDAVLDQRSTEFEARFPGSNPGHLKQREALQTEGRLEVVEVDPPLITCTPRLNQNKTGGEPSDPPSYGFDKNHTESIPSAGSETRARLVAESSNVADPS